MVLAGGGSFGGGGSGFGSGGINFGGSVGNGFDSVGAGFEGIGPLSCTPALPIAPNGLWGMSIAENLGIVGGAGALLTGLGQGIGASLAIESAGGWSAIGEMGPAATGVVGSAVLGVGAAAATGALVGTLAYNYSPDWVQSILQDAVGHTVEALGAIPDALVQANAWIVGVPVHGGPAIGRSLIP